MSRGRVIKSAKRSMKVDKNIHAGFKNSILNAYLNNVKYNNLCIAFSKPI